MKPLKQEYNFSYIFQEIQTKVTKMESPMVMRIKGMEMEGSMAIITKVMRMVWVTAMLIMETIME